MVLLRQLDRQVRRPYTCHSRFHIAGRPLSMKEQIEVGRSRKRGRWSDIYLSGGWAISLQMSRNFSVATGEFFSVAFRRSYFRGE
jgi:hypothetical protein